MSLYNIMNGATSATFFVLPVLGKHPNEYPRFRDCFMGDEERPGNTGKIHVYTRVGGGNREDYDDEIRAMRSMDGYVEDYDDSFDCTYATFVFDVPKEYESDVKLVLGGKIMETSEQYRSTLYSVYPTLKEKFDELFNNQARAVEK